MQDLIRQEEFELEVLERLNSARLLDNLVFCGGTMLRICFGLQRFSVDLDFWLVKAADKRALFKKIKEHLSRFYQVKDSADKFYTLLFELRSKDYPRSLKIEIRKEAKKVKTEQAIAYSKYSNRQVMLNVVSLEDMMRAKIEALLSRKEIRDAFDLEFLVKKGIGLAAGPDELKCLLKAVGSFGKKDYSVKLASLLEEGQRKYYITENFKILKMAIEERMAVS